MPLLPITWLSLQTSLCLFFSCSHWMISTSASTVRSWNTGHTKCDTNLQYSTVQYWAHQVRHEPVQRVQEVLLRDVEVEVGVGGGSEGIVAASLETQEMTEALVWK